MGAVAIAREEGRITAQMVGLAGTAETPEYFEGATARAFRSGFTNERAKMQRRMGAVKGL